MNSYTIDTDAGIGSILSNFDSEYILHIVDDSIQQKFRPFDGPMPNLVDVLERDFYSIKVNAPDYVENVDSVKRQTYIEILNRICLAYNLSFVGNLDYIEDKELYGIVRLMYDIFVSRFTDNIIDFFTSYIIQNADSIYAYLKTMDNINRPKNAVFSDENFIDNKFILINANINMIIYNIVSYDISLNDLLNYFCSQGIASRMSELLVDNGDIYKFFYAIYIKDKSKSPELITRIKLELQSRTFSKIERGNNDGTAAE